MKEYVRNADQFKAKWQYLKGGAKIKWGEPIDDGFDKVEGNRDKLVGIIQDRYGRTKEGTEREVPRWAK